MKKLAIDFQPLRISKPAGFRIAEAVRPIAQLGDDEDEDEVALDRCD
jgi:hypothetical protein